MEINMIKTYAKLMQTKLNSIKKITQNQLSLGSSPTVSMVSTDPIFLSVSS